MAITSCELLPEVCTFCDTLNHRGVLPLTRLNPLKASFCRQQVPDTGTRYLIPKAHYRSHHHAKPWVVYRVDHFVDDGDPL